MKIDFNRLNKLAGLPVSNKRSRSLNEVTDGKPDYDDYWQKWHGMDKDGNRNQEYEPEGGDPEFWHLSDAEPHEDDFVPPDENDFGYEEEMANEGAACDEDDEMIEVDEAMLVQELRRAKRSIVESAKRKNLVMRKRSRAKKSLVENAIKKIIAEEVENVMQDLNLTSGWIYGGNKPKRSAQGRLNHGGYLKGPGFR